MGKYGGYGKFTAHPGQRDALAQALLDAAALMQTFAECELYVVSLSETEPDTVWVTEVDRTDQAPAGRGQGIARRITSDEGSQSGGPPAEPPFSLSPLRSGRSERLTPPGTIAAADPSNG